MSNNKKKNIALIIAAGVLFLALFDGWQYGFFTILRFVVFATTAYVAWMAYEEKREKWVWIFGFIAVLFNPFFAIHLTREVWVIIDFVVGVFLLATVFFLKLDSSTTTHSNQIQDARTERKEENKDKILTLFQTKDEIANDDVEKLLGVSDATATRYLDELEQEGKVTQIGKTGKAVRYKKI